MAKPFNLTVAVNLQGPNNIKAISSQIKRELSSIEATVKLDIKAEAAKNIANINKQLESLSSAAIKAQSNVTNLGNALKQLSAGFNGVTTVSKQFNATTAVTSKSLKSSSKNVKDATTAIEEFGKQSALAVKRFAAFSIVTSVINKFTSAVTNGFSQYIEFDRQLIKIAQVTRSSKAEINALSAEITSLAKKFGASSNELAEVSLTLAQAGFSAEEAKIALEALAKTTLAATFNDINSTTEGTIALLRQFSLSTSELEAALGSINAVAAAFAVESSDIITAIQRTGGVFASASRGVSEGRDALNEFIAVFTSVRATTRESAETIATGLRTIFTRIQRGSTIKFLKEFGIELQDSQGKFVGAYEAIRRLSEGLSSLDPRDVRFSQIVEELGGFRQIGKVIPLIQEFATAQEALNIAQKGSGSLSRDAIQAQSALAVQFARTREEFTGLIKEIGQSATFKTVTTLVLGLATAFIRVTSALKPILPLITALTAIKGFKFITEFISGFGGAISGGGGLKGIGSGIGGMLTGTTPNQPVAGAGSPTAISANTTALVNLTAAVNALSSKFGSSVGSEAAINPRGGTGPFGFGPTRKFARGGIVPGSGNRDTVPAMLTPGEFVIRKSTVNKIGANNLDSINKYGIGGKVIGAQEFENYNITTSDLKDKRKGLTRALGSAARGSLLGNMFEGWLYNKYGVITQDQKFPDITNVRNNPKALKAIGGSGNLRQGVNNIEFKYKKELESKAKYNQQYTDKNTDIFYAFSKGGGVGAAGGIIQKFAKAGKVEGPKQATVDMGAQDLITMIGGPAQALEAIKNARVDLSAIKRSRDISDLVRKALIRTDTSRASKKAIVDAINKGYLREIGQLTDQGLMFGAVGMQGNEYTDQYREISEKLTSPVTVGITGRLISDRYRSLIEQQFNTGISQSTVGAAQAVTIADILQDIIGGSILVSDFDKVINEGGDNILSDSTKPQFSEFADRSKVEDALRKSKLTTFGLSLVDLLSTTQQSGRSDAYNELLNRMYINTARPQTTVDLIKSWLDSVNLPIPSDNIVGVGGPGVSGSDIPKLKAAIVSKISSANYPSSTSLKSVSFVDDAEANVEGVSQLGLPGTKSYFYPTDYEPKPEDNIAKGILLQNFLESLGAIRGKSMDFPNGLGPASRVVNNGSLFSSMPTDAKYTLSGPNDLIDNITNYLVGQGYKSGGTVSALVSNGEAYIPPKIAKKIGYSTLNRINQADRNGIGRFSSGGISVFKGPGSGTSDSIGPIGLPTGSFIIREKATKALGLDQKYNTGGLVKFRNGGRTPDRTGQDALSAELLVPFKTSGTEGLLTKFGLVILKYTKELGIGALIAKRNNTLYGQLSNELNELGINSSGLIGALKENQTSTNRFNFIQNDLISALLNRVKSLRAKGRESEIPALVQKIESLAAASVPNEINQATTTVPQKTSTQQPTRPPETTENISQELESANKTVLPNFLNKMNGLSAALAVLGPSVQDMAVSFDNLANTSYATSSEVAGLSEAVTRAGSLGLSGGLVGGQLGGKRGALIGQLGGLAAGAVSGAIQGYLNKEIQNLRGSASAAEMNIGRGIEDFATAGSREEQLQILDSLTASSIDYENSLNKAAKVNDSAAAKTARSLDILANTIINIASIFATRRELRRSSGGMVYASGGTLVDYKPKGTDTIPAMLSKGEFVVNAKSTKNNIELLRTINRNKGGVIRPIYAANGLDPRDTNKDGIVDLMEFQDAGGQLKKLSDLPQDKFDFRKTTGRSQYAEAFYQTFMPSWAKSEGPSKDKALRYAARTAAGVGAAAGVAAGGIAAAPLLAGGAGTGGTALGVTKAADVAMSAGDVVDLGSALARGDSATAGLAAASLGATLIPGSGVIKGGTRAVKGAKTVTTAAKTASKTADAASVAKKATTVVGQAPTGPITGPPTPIAPPSPVQSFRQPPAPRTPVRPPPPKPSANPPSGPPPKKGGSIFGNFFNRGPRPPSPPRTPGSPRRRGTGKGGKLAALADIFTIGLPLAQAGFDYFQGDVQTQALEQQALLGGFEQTSKVAGLRAQTLEPESLVAERALAQAAERPEGETLAQRRERLGDFTTGDIGTGGLLAEQARQQGLKGAGFELKPGQGVEEFYQTLDAEQQAQADKAIQAADQRLKKQSILAAKREKLEAQGLGADQITKELNKLSKAFDSGTASAEDLADGTRLMGREEDKLAKQLKDATAIKAFAKNTADLTAIMPRISAAMNRLSSEMQASISQTNSYVAALQGNGSAVSSVSASIEKDSAVLQNITAYTATELSEVLDRAVTGMGGGENIKQAAELVKAQQVLEKSRPSIEAAIKEFPTEAGGTENIKKVLGTAFEGIEGISKDIKESFIEGAASSIAASTAGGEATQQAIDSFLAKSTQAQQLFIQYSQFAAEGLKNLASQTDNLSQALIRSQELEIESATLGIESGNRLKEALGKTLSTEERTASFDKRIESMTAVRGRQGTSDPAEIANRLRQDVARQQKIGVMAPGEQKVDAVAKESAGLVQSIAQNRKALELLARDTTRADAAIAKIASRDKQLRAQADTAIDLAADPMAAMEFLGGAGAIGRVMSGQASQADLKEGKAALKQLEGLLSPEEFQQLSDRFMQGAQQAFPELGGFALTGAQREADPQMQANIQAYNDAIATQQAALAQLQQLEQTTITELTSNIDSLRHTINTGLKTAVSEIEAELNKFKNKLKETMQANQANAAPAQPAPVAALAPQPPIMSQTMSQQALQAPGPLRRSQPDAEGRVRTVEGDMEAYGGIGEIRASIPDKINFDVGGTTNVVVTFNPSDLKMFDNLKEELTKSVGSQLAKAINDETKGGLRLSKYLA